MGVDIFAAMGQAIDVLLQPKILFYIFLGTLIGTFLSAIPGVGGLLGIALLLPFTFSLSAHEAAAFLLGALAVLSTADTIPAILFGVPGTPTSMATVLDGYPMAQKGQAGRALGAAFTASILGGVIGALPLFFIVPIIIPVLMGATSPELLSVCILGLAMVAALSGGSMYKGLAAASIGILLAMIGQDGQTATLRWTFEELYLWNGVSILVVVLGIYAIPELADLAIQRRSIARYGVSGSPMRGAWQGVRDAFNNFWLVTRSSGISSAMGALPAIGPAVIPWIVYSYAASTTRGPSEFGRGDVRGVIASESSNNATVGGSLLPTVALGIPGSAPMALLLGAFLLHGVAPGPDMLTKNLDFTFMMVWTIPLANIIGGLLAFVFAVQLSRIVFARVSIIVPVMLAIVFVGTVQSERHWHDLTFLLAIGLLGWLMKRARWPRAPFILAFILAPLVERYYFISTRIHDWQWMLRPAVAVILLLTIAFLAWVAAKRVLRIRRLKKRIGRRTFAPVLNIEAGLAIVTLVVCVAAYFSAADWAHAARAVPQIAAIAGVVTAAGALMSVWLKPVAAQVVTEAAEQSNPTRQDDDDEIHYDLTTDFGDLSPRQIGLYGLKYALFLCLFFALSWLVSVIAAVPLFVLVYMLSYGERLRVALPTSIVTGVVCYLVFEWLLRLPWPVPYWNGTAWLQGLL